MRMQWLFFFLFLSYLSHMPIIVQSKCNHQSELSALLQFKDGFQVKCINSFGHPKTSSWNINGTAKWDGVECNPVSGHVIGLDLTYSCLQGSINSNSSRSLFSHLVHLEHLDLSYNDFSGSTIPSELGNMSSLRSLNLDFCGVYGEFPQSIFYLPKLQYLSLQGIDELEGHLPTEFNSSTTPSLESLFIWRTKFKGGIPVSIGNHITLRELELSYSQFSGGSIPSSLGNLTHLTSLDLSSFIFTSPSNNFTTLSWLGKLTNLTYLSIAKANLIGEIPNDSSLANLTHLTSLDLSYNQLSGQIPSVLAKLTQLSYMTLIDNQLTGGVPPGFVNLEFLFASYNMLSGPLPIQNMTNLKSLDVSHNQLRGTLEFDLFLELSNLTSLDLSSNKLTLLLKHQRNVSTNSMLPKFGLLELSSCQISKFPEFLQHQQDLEYLNLSYNNIEGPIPKWMGSIQSLYSIDISHNKITGMEDPFLFLLWPNVRYLDISFNKLRGSAPIPSSYVLIYQASNNELTGEMPYQFCNLPSLQGLDFSSNRLTGELDPYCFSQSELRALNLQNNSFNGKIPEFCPRETNPFLAMIDLNGNQFQGKIPRSLANCAVLEFFDAGSNLINDTFPSWLGSLPELKVLLLKNNALHGSIGTMPSMRSGYWFPELIIIDISQNSLSGNLTSWHFEQWMAMKRTHSRNTSYMEQSMSNVYASGTFYYSLTMNNKGTETEYSKILDALVAIDLSSNEFEGEIPTIIGDLLGLRSLNLSNNHLSGGIPSSLGVITHLESLDLSSNRLSGHLPQQLTGLNFLSVFNVSHNNLTGHIPQGRQFDTFSNMSYVENPGLCGEPLSIKCETFAAQPPDEMAEKEDKFWKGEILWMVVAIGFGGGLVVGVAVENIADWRMLIILSWRRMRNWRNSRG